MAEKTFQNYDKKQAEAYATKRVSSYSDEIYQAILNYHKAKDGEWRCYLDIGCGPGNSTHDLARFFDKAIGIDHSEHMVKRANEAHFQSKLEHIHFRVANAENFDSVADVSEGSVDLISAGMAAHWFDMDKFWKIAGRVLAPGGTVALWTCSSLYCHPTISKEPFHSNAPFDLYPSPHCPADCFLDPDTPNAKAVQDILFYLENDILGKYALPGNIVSQHMYEDLLLPWDLMPPELAFDKQSFSRKEWNRDGKLEPGQSDFVAGIATNLHDMRESGSTASMYTRWAAANPDLVGTENDCLHIQVRQIREATGLNDFDDLKLGMGVVLLLFSKSL